MLRRYGMEEGLRIHGSHGWSWSCAAFVRFPGDTIWVALYELVPSRPFVNIRNTSLCVHVLPSFSLLPASTAHVHSMLCCIINVPFVCVCVCADVTGGSVCVLLGASDRQKPGSLLYPFSSSSSCISHPVRTYANTWRSGKYFTGGM